MKTDDKGTRERALEHEVDVGSPILRYVALPNDTLLLELLVGELVRAQLLVLLLFALLALRLTADVVQV